MTPSSEPSSGFGYGLPDLPFAEIAAGSPVPLFVCFEDGENVFVNEAYARFQGRDPDRVLGHGWHDLLPPSAIGDYLERFRAGTALGERFTHTVSLDPDGVSAEFDVLMTPLGAERAGRPLWVGTVRNVSRLRQAEEQAAMLSTRYRNIIHGSPVFFVSADATGLITLVDVSDLQAHLRSWVGRRFQDLIAGEPRAEEGFRRVMEEGVPQTRRVEDGGRIYQVNWYPVFAAGGCLSGVEAIASDVTERVRFDEQLRAAFDGVVGVITQLTDVADPYTRGHEESVADIAAAIARELGVEEASIAGLRVAARLHDTGKIAVPTVLLARSGALNEAEFNLIKTHVDAARRIFENIDFPWPEIEAIYEHHERLDGSGYPLGLKGDEIGYAGRILAVADVCDAMTSHRPYRPARSLAELVAELRQGRGRLYDEAAVDVAIGLIESGRMPFRQVLGADRHGEIFAAGGDGA